MLSWNSGQALSLAKLDATFSATNKFAMCTSSERSGFVSQGPLLSTWSEQVPPFPPPTLESFVGQGSMLISSYWKKTEPLVCAAQEAQKHTIQFLEALGSILPAGSRVSTLLTGLSCRGFPIREALYKQLGNLCARTLRSVHGYRRGTRYPSPPFRPPYHAGLFCSDCQTI